VSYDWCSVLGLHSFPTRRSSDLHVRQVIVKRLRPEIALRGALIAERWLPAVGMRDSGPSLLGSVAEPGGNCAWHVYDDLGPCELDRKSTRLNSSHGSISYAVFCL